jgi:ABC-2 type transport system ATP-binding protein
MTMSQALIETQGLTKSYGSLQAVAGFDWTVEAGSLSALVGPNGAGKTTVLKMLLGMTRPTAGSATVLGYDIVNASVEIRQRVALVPEDKLLYDDMKVAPFLKFVGSFFPTWDQTQADGLLAGWEVPRHREIKELSKGMRAKLVLAAALSRNPQVLFLDEPTIDLDPAGVEEVLSWISGWVAEGERCAVVATHRLEEVERICDRITFLQGGRTILSAEVDDLKADWKSLTVYGKLRGEEVRGWAGVRGVSGRGEVTNVVVEANAEDIRRRLEELAGGAVEVHPMSLREIYLAATGFRRRVLDDALESLD